MNIEIKNGLVITEIRIWAVNNPEAQRIKANVSITFNDCLRVNGCRIIEGAKGRFLSYPSEKIRGGEEWIPHAHAIARGADDKIQDAVLKAHDEALANMEPKS